MVNRHISGVHCETKRLCGFLRRHKRLVCTLQKTFIYLWDVKTSELKKFKYFQVVFFMITSRRSVATHFLGRFVCKPVQQQKSDLIHWCIIIENTDTYYMHRTVERELHLQWHPFSIPFIKNYKPVSCLQHNYYHICMHRTLSSRSCTLFLDMVRE